MAGIADVDVIDLVGQDATGRTLLIMVESRAWGADAAQESQLKQKINLYFGFIADGSLMRTYPETAARDVVVQLNCMGPLRGEFARIFEHAAQQFAAEGITFLVHVSGEGF